MNSHNKRKHWGGNKEKKQERPQKNHDDVDMDESSPVVQMFRSFQEELDHKHDKHERIVKLSRDVTIESKRAIFLLHRVNSGGDGEDIFKQTEEKLRGVESTKFSEIAKELLGTDPFKYLRAYTAGLQEYIEALTFYHYLKDKRLIGLEEVNTRLTFMVDAPQTTPLTDDTTPTNKDMEQGAEQISVSTQQENTKQTLQLPVPFEEYILGVADLTGELMRRAINSVGAGNLEEPFNICNFLQEMEIAFASLGNTNREVGRKLHTLRQSIRKVESACYTLKVRGSEIPKHMLADVFSKASGPEYIDPSCMVDDD